MASEGGPSIVLHYLNNSRAHRILWLLEELEVPYELKKYQRTSSLLAPPELKEVHPLGKSPVLEDGDVKLVESAVIIEYLIGKYGPQFEVSAQNKLLDSYYTHYAETTVMPILTNKLIYTIVPSKTPLLVRPIASAIMSRMTANIVEPALKGNCALIEEHLSKSPSGWFAGDDHPTPADFMMSFPMELLKSRYPEGAGDNIKAFVKKVHDRPAYQRALEKGGPYAYAEI